MSTQNKFAVGDRVRLVTTEHGYICGEDDDRFFQIGCMGIVTDTNWEDGATIAMYGYKNPVYFSYDEFELVEEHPVPSSNESGSLVRKISAENDAVSSVVSENQPKAKDNSWHENGELPPVNTKCIYLGIETEVEGIILAHVESKFGYRSAIIQCADDWWHGEAGEFRPWCSKEQIAAQEREKVVNKMCDICNPSGIYPEASKLMCNRLYDAGLRFVKEGE